MSQDKPLSAARLRKCLADTRLPDDPTRVVLPDNIDTWLDKDPRTFAAGLKPAGVLIPIIQRVPHMTVLLTRRSAELKHHASQVSFPGGRMEKHDIDIAATALRETREEVGIRDDAIAVIGYLEPLPTITGYAVTPIVGLIDPPIRLAIDPGEVDVAFEVPLEFLMDENNAKSGSRIYRGVTIPTLEFHFGGHRIWGATANMLVKLREKLL